MTLLNFNNIPEVVIQESFKPSSLGYSFSEIEKMGLKVEAILMGPTFYSDVLSWAAFDKSDNTVWGAKLVHFSGLSENQIILQSIPKYKINIKIIFRVKLTRYDLAKRE
jgi:hypothetical protein